MSYKNTSYPNVLGHRNYANLLDDVIKFREIVDSECYRHAYDFVCHVLQPECVGYSIRIPCKSFCMDFMKGCGNRVASLVKTSLDCSLFPEVSFLVITILTWIIHLFLLSPVLTI